MYSLFYYFQFPQDRSAFRGGPAAAADIPGGVPVRPSLRVQADPHPRRGREHPHVRARPADHAGGAAHRLRPRRRQAEDGGRGQVQGHPLRAGKQLGAGEKERELEGVGVFRRQSLV